MTLMSFFVRLFFIYHYSTVASSNEINVPGLILVILHFDSLAGVLCLDKL